MTETVAWYEFQIEVFTDDETGKPLPVVGAEVVVGSTDLGVTDEDGRFSFARRNPTIFENLNIVAADNLRQAGGTYRMESTTVLRLEVH